MDIGNLFWIFFIVMALQPLIAARWTRSMRAQRIAAIQKARNSRVIAIIHRQEAMRFFGFPIARYIDLEDAGTTAGAGRLTARITAVTGRLAARATAVTGTGGGVG